MITALQRLFAYIPQPWRVLVQIALVILAISLGFYLFGQIQSCRYDKARGEYQQKEEAWKVERTKLIADAEAKEKRIQELEPKVAAYEQLAEQKKRLDQNLSDKIDKLVEDAKREEELTNEPTDCATRARRVCEKFRANNIPIDCAQLIAKCTG